MRTQVIVMVIPIESGRVLITCDTCQLHRIVNTDEADAHARAHMDQHQ